MGCWNETCGISKMRITYGEKVRFLPIVMNPYHVIEVKGFPFGEPMILKGASGTYIGDLWTPLCYPIRAEYNDYGSIEDVPDKTHKDIAELCQFLEAFKKYCLPIEMGDNKYHDVSIKNFTLAEILEALREGRCFMEYKSPLPEYKNRIVPISWMMIKESVWQSLLKIDIKKSGEIWSHGGKEDRYSLDGIRKSIIKLIEKSAAFHKLENAKLANDEDKLKNALELLKAIRGFSFSDLRFWHNSPIACPSINEDIIDIIVECEYIHLMLGILRINYAPTTGSGSQCDNYSLWKLVYKEWSNIITEDEN